MNTSPQNLSRIEAYVRSIRNRGKRTYGERYLRNLRKGWDLNAINAPCSPMAAQAVRLRISELL